MRQGTTRRLRRYATATVIAIVPMAIMCGAMTYLLNPKPNPVALDVMPVVAIENSNQTIGIADSDMYDPTLSNADIIKRFDEMQSLGVNTVRVLIPWGVIQPAQPGSPLETFFPQDWSRIDFIVSQAQSRNMGVLGVLNSTPYWGGQNGVGCLGCFGVA